MSENKVFMALVSTSTDLEKRGKLSFRNVNDTYVDNYHTDLVASPDSLMTLDEALAVFDKYSKNKSNRQRIAKMDEGKFVVAGYRSRNSDVFIVRLPQEDVDFYAKENELLEKAAEVRKKINDLVPQELKDELREAEKALKKHRKS